MTTPHANAPATVPRPCVSPFTPFEMTRASDPYYIAIRFKPSPFFQVDQAVSTIAECPGMLQPTNRHLHNLTPCRIF